MTSNQSSVLGYLFVGGAGGILCGALITGIGVSAWGIRETINGIASRGWPTTEGRIESITVTEDLNDEYSSSPVWKVRFVYGYEVGGKHFRGERQRYDGGSKAGHDGDYNASRGFLERHQQGQAIPVWYDPRSPAHSTLEPGFRSSALFIVCAGAFMLGVVGFMVVGILRGLRW